MEGGGRAESESECWGLEWNVGGHSVEGEIVSEWEKFIGQI